MLRDSIRKAIKWWPLNYFGKGLKFVITPKLKKWRKIIFLWDIQKRRYTAKRGYFIVFWSKLQGPALLMIVEKPTNNGLVMSFLMSPIVIILNPLTVAWLKNTPEKLLKTVSLPLVFFHYNPECSRNVWNNNIQIDKVWN